MSTVTFGAGKNSGEKVGVKVSVSQQALNYIMTEMIPRAEAMALAVDIPDMTAEHNVPAIGPVDVSLKNIKLNRLSVGNASIDLNAGNAVTVAVIGLNLDITLDWHYGEKKWPHIGDSGTGEASTTRASGKITVVLGSDTTGHPTAKFATCGLDMSSLSIKLHGGASWLYDAVITLFHKPLVSLLDKSICNIVTTKVQDRLSKYMAAIPVEHAVGSHFAVDYSLADPNGIVVSPENYVVGSVQGEFFPKGGQPGKAPWKTVKMPDSVVNKEFQIFITDFAIESLGYTAVTTGLAEYLVTKDKVPAFAKDFFVTDFYSQYAPGIIDKFGAGDEVAVFLALHQTPDVIFSKAGGIDVKAGVEMTLRAKNTTTGAFADAASILVSCVADGDAKVADGMITGELTNLQASATLVQTQIGPVDIDGINDFIQFCISMGLDYINNILATGAPLPTIPGLQFLDPSIIYADDYIVVATNVNFTLPSKF